MEYKLNEYQDKMYNDHVQNLRTLKMGLKMTVAHLTLKNGFEVIGVSGCEDPDKYVYETGRHFAIVDGLRKIDELLAYARANTPVTAMHTGKVSNEVLHAIRKEVHSGMMEAINHSPIRPFGSF